MIFLAPKSCVFLKTSHSTPLYRTTYPWAKEPKKRSSGGTLDENHGMSAQTQGMNKGGHHPWSSGAKKRAVTDSDDWATSSGVPQATTRPPPCPPSGPMSMM